MTSRVSCFKMTVNAVKRRLWYGAVCFLMFFIAFPLSAMLRFQSADEIMQYMVSADEKMQMLENARADFQAFVGGGDAFLMILVIGIALLGAWSGLSWLHSRKKMDLFGSIPVRRDKLLWTESLAGLFLYVLPYIINLSLAMLIGVSKGILTGKTVKLGLMGFGIHLFYFIVLYFFGVVAMLLTGKVLTGILGTAVILSFGPALCAVWNVYQEMYLKTFVSSDEWLMNASTLLSPVGSFGRTTVRIANWLDRPGSDLDLTMPLAAAAVAGILMAAVSFWLIRIRKTEGAGVAMAFAKTEGPIKLGILYFLGLGGGCFFRRLGEINGKRGAFWLCFGMVFTLLVGSILIEIIYSMDKKRIFEHKIWTGIAAGAVFLTGICFMFDLTGYDKWIPDKEDVAHAVVCTENSWQRYPDGSRSTFEYLENHVDEFSVDFAYPVAEKGVAALKESQLDISGEGITVIYRMNSGRIKKRTYRISTEEWNEIERKMYREEAYKKAIFPMLLAENENLRGETVWVLGESISLAELNEEEQVKLAEIYGEELLTLEYDEIYRESVGTLYMEEMQNGEFLDVRELPLNGAFKKTLGFLKEKGILVDFSWENKEIQNIRFMYNEEEKVMDDPEMLRQAVENLVALDSGYSYRHTSVKENGVAMYVNYISENGERVECYCGYSMEGMPQIVEEFLGV